MTAGTRPPAYEARPTWTKPNAPAATASNGAFSLYKDALARNHAYAAATSTLAQALLVSIGPDNKFFLEARFAPDPLYSLAPRQIVDAMFSEHGTTNPQDLALLRAPLHEPLPALANLEHHMSSFTLASKKLTAAGQGKTPYEYFEIFLETLKGFPVVGQCLPAYYVAHTTIHGYTENWHPTPLPQVSVRLFAGPVCGFTVLRGHDPCPKVQEQKEKEGN